MRRIVIGAVCLASLSLSARETWAEAIYWKPIDQNHEWASRFVGPADYNSEQINSGSFDTQNICSDYNVGVRAGLSYNFCNLFADLSGSYIQFKDGSRATGRLFPTLPLQWVTIDLGGAADRAMSVQGAGRGDLSVYHWHAELRSGWLWRCGRAVRLFGGVRYTSLQERLSAHLAGVPGFPSNVQFADLRQVRRSAFSGAGPLFGLRAGALLTCGLGIEAEGEIIALIGSRKTVSRAHLVTQPPTGPIILPVSQLFNQGRSVAIVPALDLKAALNYSFCWQWLKGRAEIGYSLIYYRNIYDIRPSGSNIPSLVSEQSLRSAGFAGPHIGGSLLF